MNNIVDYLRSEFVEINQITSRFLRGYDGYLRSERAMVRKNQFGTPVTYVRKGMGDGGIHAHMRDLRLLFKAAQDHYKDEDREAL